MHQDAVPEGLLEAFRRDGRGAHRVRHLDRRDLVAVVLAIVLTALLVGLVALAVALIDLVGDDRAHATTVVAATLR